MDAKELLRRYAAGERNFARIKFSSQSLCEADLSGINLSGADLGALDLSRANLSNANLSRAKRCLVAI
ncbi:pentapeptide repeat-containing protein [Microcoleus sp. FACHB-831]|uniref:pentapeptide repeat-containing protein n=1 Tax=Microcoleus sp. FACHB-831 TaxID=2692827 RepID=UPI001683576E|nr:pentapeptide repeat-containing protein [Microcoleus sp. FACHB-831]MBD1924653.1 pentapeptide repeat-containing protein [Microcoleus sp. FACHB-831]